MGSFDTTGHGELMDDLLEGDDGGGDGEGGGGKGEGLGLEVEGLGEGNGGGREVGGGMLVMSPSVQQLQQPSFVSLLTPLEELGRLLKDSAFSNAPAKQQLKSGRKAAAGQVSQLLLVVMQVAVGVLLGASAGGDSHGKKEFASSFFSFLVLSSSVLFPHSPPVNCCYACHLSFVCVL